MKISISDLGSSVASSVVMRQFASSNVGKTLFFEPMANHAYWRIGGPADLLVLPESIEQVSNAVVMAKKLGLPLITIGDGSNLLFDDLGVRGVVMKIGRRLGGVQIDGQRVVAQAGAYTPCLARKLGHAGLRGFEHAVGIPGTIGGLVLMNGGSQRKGVGSHVVGVQVVTPDGQLRYLGHDECGFGYRHSVLQGAELVIVAAEFRFEQGSVQGARAEMLEVMRSRRRKFPLKNPSCGSVFLSDPAIFHLAGPPGKIVEDVGFKGVRLGGAQVSPLHANFILNLGGATSVDVLTLIKKIRQSVHDSKGFWLDCEVRYVSPDGQIFPAHRAVSGR